MLKSSAFYGLWACYFISCLAGLMAIPIAKPVGADGGIETGLVTPEFSRSPHYEKGCHISTTLFLDLIFPNV